MLIGYRHDYDDNGQKYYHSDFDHGILRFYLDESTGKIIAYDENTKKEITTYAHVRKANFGKKY